MNRPDAPGHPGIPARWTSSAKTGVGTAATGVSRVWFTLSHGILNEVYFPRVDRACIRDFGLIVTAAGGFFSEEKRHCTSRVESLAPGVPGFRVVNTCRDNRYRIDKVVIADPARDVVLQRVTFTPLAGSIGDYRLFALLAPHLDNCGDDNTAVVTEYKGVPVLAAEREHEGRALALLSSGGWLARSVGFVGFSDGWQQLSRDGKLCDEYQRAARGNVALVGELETGRVAQGVVLALGFGLGIAEAAHNARASLLQGFDSACRTFVREWKEWQASLVPPPQPARTTLYLGSAAIIRTHEAKHAAGGIIASLSIPWGFSRGDDDLGGYHLVWPRDLAQAGTALVALGDNEGARSVLRFLQATQENDGRWSQNMWLDGTPYWQGIQIDETAAPILLADLALRAGVLEGEALSFFPMVKKAADFIVRSGPSTPQDRWEENAGYSPYTLAAEIAALLAAAEWAERAADAALAALLRETADRWNANVEGWTYVTGTELAHRLAIDGYYARVGPEGPDDVPLARREVVVRNQPGGRGGTPAGTLVSPDALALVRYGLRSATDPRILSTIKAIDALLEVDTPLGPVWRRYNGDGYGEHDDGKPFDGVGLGRPWALLTGERAHYELAAGHGDRAEALCDALERFAGSSGLIPEQIWDGPEVPTRELTRGGASGSARPLVWAHAEYIKLCHSLAAGRVFDLPPQTAHRYVTAPV
jgi:glucoamylase